jgi:hypothetical protein
MSHVKILAPTILIAWCLIKLTFLSSFLATPTILCEQTPIRYPVRSKIRLVKGHATIIQHIILNIINCILYELLYNLRVAVFM